MGCARQEIAVRLRVFSSFMKALETWLDVICPLQFGKKYWQERSKGKDTIGI